MAGRKRKTLDEQIQQIDENIQAEKEKAEAYAAASRARVKDMEDKRRQLSEQKREKEVQDILELADDNGLSIEELKNLICERSENSN